MPSYSFYPLSADLRAVLFLAALAALLSVAFSYFWLSVLLNRLRKQIGKYCKRLTVLPPPPNKSSFSQSPHDNTVNTDTAETPAAAPVPSTPAPPVFAEEKETAVIQPATVSDTPDEPKPFEYLEIKVAGVTFKNDKGPTRQTLLKKIKQRSAPFDEYLEISINQYDFEGELAYSVCVNDRQIGNVPKSQVQYLHDNIERFVAITGINVYGGYRDENGYFKSYGAAITVKFRLSDNNT